MTKEERPTRDIYTGTADEIISTGFVVLGQLPGQWGRAESVTRYSPAGRPIAERSPGVEQEGAMVIESQDRTQYTLSVNVGDREFQRRMRTRSREEVIRKARQRANLDLAAFPKTETQFRGLVESRVWLDVANRMAAGERAAGYSFDTATQRRLSALTAEFAAVVRAGTVCFDVNEHARVFDHFMKPVRELEAENE
jgi:hypothetical protein